MTLYSKCILIEDELCASLSVVICRDVTLKVKITELTNQNVD